MIIRDLMIWLGIMILCMMALWWCIGGMRRSGTSPIWIETITVVGTYGWWGIILLESYWGIPVEELGALEMIYILLSPLLMPALAMMTAARREESIQHELVHLGAAIYTPGLIAIYALSTWR